MDRVKRIWYLSPYASSEGSGETAHPDPEFAIWTASSEFGTYHVCEQRRFRRDCADQARLRIRAVSPEPSLLAHTSSESRGTFRQKIRSLAPLNGWACAVEICHDGMLEDTNSLDGAHMMSDKEKKYCHI